MSNRQLGLSSLYAFAAFVVIVLGLQAASSILIPFIFAIFLSIIVWPFMRWLVAHRVPYGASIVIVILTIIGILVVLGATVGGSINDFSDRLPFYESQLRIRLSSLIQDSSQQAYIAFINEQLSNFSPLTLIGNLFEQISGFLSNFILIIFTIIFLLLEASTLPKKIGIIFSVSDSDPEFLNQFTQGVQRYLGIKTIISVITGLIVAAFTFLIGLDFPMLWGLTAFLLNYVPTIGSLIAAVPAVALAIVQLGISDAIIIAIGYFAINFFIGGILEPRIMGKGLGLSTLVVFLSLVFWGWVFGPVGMLLSVPLTMTAKIACSYNEKTKIIAVLLSGASDIKK